MIPPESSPLSNFRGALKYTTSHIDNWDKSFNFEDTARYLNDLLETEMEKIIVAEVPVCVVTSSGLDSSYLTALASRFVSGLNCFNIAYEGDWPSDERIFAKEVSDYYGATYNQVLIKESEFPEILSKTIHHLGQPNSAPHSLSTYALFKAINQAGFKVAITGEGADEFFGGYERFKIAAFNADACWAEQYFDMMSATTYRMRDIAYSNEYKNYLFVEKHWFLESAKNRILFRESKLNRAS